MALHTIGRLQLKRPPDEWIRLAMTTVPVRIAELSPAIAIDAGRIPRDVLADPVDRLLVATALEMEATLLTADDRILQYGNAVQNAAHGGRGPLTRLAHNPPRSRQAHGAANAGIAAGCRMMVAPAGHQMTEPDAEGDALVIGRKLLHYEIVARLGAGGMGEVWRAVDPRLQRDVAIKILPSAGGDAALLRERFVREARAASALAHPNIITIHEINAADGTDFIVMEYVRGEPLSDVLARGPLTVARVEYAVPIAAALKAAHDAGIVHRDLKPGNVMIAASGLVKVLDFGIAKRVSSAAAEANSTTEAALTVLGESIGTPAYMSPEQALGDPVDARSDVFSFGVVLYQMLTGRLPYQATTKLSLVRQIVHEPPIPLETSAPRSRPGSYRSSIAVS